MMNVDEINEQLGAVAKVDLAQFEQLQWYLNELLKWNRKINLTSITAIDECWEKHIVDSLLAACFIEQYDNILDIGSGAGFPSIPLQIVYAKLLIDSVDSVSKKISFQRHCVRQLGLKGFTAHAKRIESFRDEKAGMYDVVISRAFTSLDNFIEIAVPFMKPSGRIVAMKGAAAANEVELSRPVLDKYGLVVARRKEIVLSGSKSIRVLLEIKQRS